MTLQTFTILALLASLIFHIPNKNGARTQVLILFTMIISAWYLMPFGGVS